MRKRRKFYGPRREDGPEFGLILDAGAFVVRQPRLGDLVAPRLRRRADDETPEAIARCIASLARDARKYGFPVEGEGA